MKRKEINKEFLESLPRSKDEAIQQGKRYFLADESCPQGHPAVRIVSGGQCFLCKREKTKQSAERRRRRLGMHKFEPNTPLPPGLSYGSLTTTGALKRETSQGSKRKYTQCYHEARCNCGAIVWIRADQWGKQESCYSCKQKRAGYRHGLSRGIEMSLWEAAKQRAKRSKIPFAIKITDIHIPETCPILGFPLDTRIGVCDSRKPRSNAPSLDRLDSSKGYTPDNVAVMSYRANVLKRDGTAEEHLKVAEFMERMGVTDGS